MKNVEIKAAIKDSDELERILKDMKLEKPQIMKQHDIFFNSLKGRLKMRKFEDNHGELIFYERCDTEGPKLSSYDKIDLLEEDFGKLSNILSETVGILGEVKKTRYLYLVGQTRVHVDSVEGLGNFLELEVVLEPNQSIEEGQAIAESLMKKFEIHSKDLINCSYMDLLKKK